MILYKAIKYKFLELCLDSFLRNIYKNISIMNIEIIKPDLIIPGMKFSRMEIGDTYDFWFTYWTNVEIIYSGHLKDDLNDNTHVLEFFYSETNFVHKTTDISGRERIFLSAEQDFLRIFK